MAPTVKPDDKAPATDVLEPKEPKEQTAKSNEEENKSIVLISPTLPPGVTRANGSLSTNKYLSQKYLQKKYG